MPSGPIPFDELFDPPFLASLKGLRIVARRVPRGGRPADQRSRDLGSGIEFRDFRAYVPGDDFRAIDWSLYRRLGKVFLRLFEELEDLPLYLMPDVSSSMFLESPPRAHAALRATLALGAISLAQHDRIGVYAFGETVVDPQRPKAGRGRVMQVARHLASLPPSGTTNLAHAVRDVARRGLRPGLLAIVSDFFDPAGLDELRQELRTVRHRLLFVQLVRATDSNPDLRGDVRLLDCETGGAADVTITPALLDQYRAAYGRFEDELLAIARRSNAGLLRLDADAPVAPQLAKLFGAGRYVA